MTLSKTKLAVFAAMMLLSCSMLFVSTSVLAQGPPTPPCFCMGSSTTFQGDSIFTCDADNGILPCTATDCSDCRYLAIRGLNLEGTCCISSITVSAGGGGGCGPCFCACAVLRTPTAYIPWRTTCPSCPPLSWTPTTCTTNPVKITDTNGFFPLCGSSNNHPPTDTCCCDGSGCGGPTPPNPPPCNGSLLFVRICGSFPMTITVDAKDCLGNSCAQQLYIP